MSRAGGSALKRARGWFVSSTGTSAGKTFVTRGIVRAWVSQGLRVAALKPIETGCDPIPLDARALAGAARLDAPALESEAFYRAAPPLSPYAVELSTGQRGPDLGTIVAQVRRLEPEFDQLIVEGAGGLLVPVSKRLDIADLVARLAYPLILVAPDQLGVLSHVLTAYEAATRRGLVISAIALTQQQPRDADPSVETNAQILAERTGRPVARFPFSPDDDDALANACSKCGLLAALA